MNTLKNQETAPPQTQLLNCSRNPRLIDIPGFLLQIVDGYFLVHSWCGLLIRVASPGTPNCTRISTHFVVDGMKLNTHDSPNRPAHRHLHRPIYTPRTRHRNLFRTCTQACLFVFIRYCANSCWNWALLFLYLNPRLNPTEFSFSGVSCHPTPFILLLLWHP